MSARKVHDFVLRSLLCCTWMFAFIMAFFEFLYSENTDGNDSTTFLLRCAGCIAVGIIAACMHAKMIALEVQNGEDD